LVYAGKFAITLPAQEILSLSIAGSVSVEMIYKLFEKERLITNGGVYFSSEIKYYTIFDNEDDEILTNACFLSNNLVMLPYHCLQVEDFGEFKYGDTLSDFAIVEVLDQSRQVQSLNPAIFPESGSDTFRLYMEHNAVVTLRERIINDFYVVFQFTEDLETGDSGSVIFGTGGFKNAFNEEYCSFGYSPLFMIIARSRENHREGVAISLPMLLNQIRFNFNDSTLPALPTDFWKTWEPISSFGQVKGQVNDEANKMQSAQRTKLIEALTSYPSKPAEIEILKKLFEDKSKADLQNAFLLSTSVGTEQSDMCWVVSYEKENLAASTGYFKEVGNYMIEKMENITGTNVYSTTSKPITLDASSLAYFKKQLKNKNPTACHHPFLCELNDACKGDKRKTSKSNKNLGLDLESRYISHCCIRPSHLVNLNKDFNSYCTVLQGIYENGQSEMKTVWNRVKNEL